MKIKTSRVQTNDPYSNDMLAESHGKHSAFRKRVFKVLLVTCLFFILAPVSLILLLVASLGSPRANAKVAQVGTSYFSGISSLCTNFVKVPVVGNIAENCRLTALASGTAFSVSADFVASVADLGLIGRQGALGDAVPDAAGLATRLGHSHVAITRVATEAATSTSIVGKFLTTGFTNPKYAGWLLDLGAGSRLAEQLPQLTGADTVTRYAVVFVNNFHQTPGGGQLDSVAVVSLANGKIVDMVGFTPKQLASRQVGVSQVAPQYVQYVASSEGVANSTWHTAFADTATDITKLLEESVGVSVDGVVQVDSTAVNGLLSVSGPVEVPTKGKLIGRVTGDDTQLSDVARAWLAVTPTLDATSKVALAKVLYGLLEEKHVVMYVPSATSVLTDLGWTDKVSAPTCGANCLIDEVLVTDALLTSGSVELTKSIYIHVTVSEDVATNSATITYLPVATSGSQVLTQVALPKDADLAPVEILTAAGRSVAEPVVYVSTDDTTKLAQTLVKLSDTSPVSVTFSWRRPVYVDFSKQGKYALVVGKQRGSPDDEIYIQVDLPDKLLVGEWAANLTQQSPTLDKPGEIGYNSKRASKYAYAGRLRSDLILTNFWVTH